MYTYVYTCMLVIQHPFIQGTVVFICTLYKIDMNKYVRTYYVHAYIVHAFMYMPSLYVCVYTYVFPIVCQTFVSHSVVTHCFYSLCFTDLSNAEGTMFLEKSRSYTKLLGGMFHSSIQVFTVVFDFDLIF